MLQNFKKCNTLCISCYKISKNVTSIYHARRINPTTTPSLHVEYPQQVAVTLNHNLLKILK